MRDGFLLPLAFGLCPLALALSSGQCLCYARQVKQIIGVFLTSLLLVPLMGKPAWADCGEKIYDPVSDTYGCPIGINEPCDPPLDDWCCNDKSECSTITPPPGAGPPIEPYDPECAGAGGAGVKTALGCLPVDAKSLQVFLSPWAIFLGAGVAFLLGLYGAFLIATASGDPEKVQAGKELITSVVLGLLVIIFAVFLLEVIGVDVLGLFQRI